MHKILLFWSIFFLASLIIACSPPKGEIYPSFLLYERKDLGFSIEHPKDWDVEEFNDNEIGIKPEDGIGTEIQMGAFNATPFLTVMPTDEAASLIELSLQEFVNSIEGDELTMISIESTGNNTNGWYWIALFFYYYEGLPMRGGYYIQETETMSYTLIYTSRAQLSEIDKIIHSFRVI